MRAPAVMLLEKPLVGLALCVGLAALAACQVIPTDGSPGAGTENAGASASTAETVESVERMLAVEIMGQTVGVVETRLDKAADGSWTTHELVTFTMTRQGGGPSAQFSSTTESVSHFDAQHEFLSEVEIEREAGVTITRTVSREGNELVSSYTGPGRDTPEVERFAIPADYRSSLAVDFELRAEFERTGQPATRSFSTFDADRGRFEVVEVTLLGAAEFTHGGESMPAYRFRSREEDGTVLDTLTDHDFMPLELDSAGTFTASLVDERPVLGEGGGTINSELPVGGKTTSQWWTLSQQEVTVTVTEDTKDDRVAPPLWEDSHYHRVAHEGDRYTMTLLSTRPPAGFVAPDLPMTVPEALQRFLEPTPMAQSDAPMVAAAAAEIVAGERDALLAAERIVTAVFQGLDKRAGVRGSATAAEVLVNGAGDCTEHAVLVVAFMRAAGIPARAVDGIVLASDGDGKGVAGYHAWAEIWLGEWIGVDATVDETGTSARYLQFGIDEPGEPSSNGKMMRSIGKTRIELGPHQTRDD